MKIVRSFANAGLILLLWSFTACRKQSPSPTSPEDTKRIVALEEEVKQLKSKSASPTPTDSKQSPEKFPEKEFLGEAITESVVQLDQAGIILHIHRILLNEKIVAAGALTKPQLEFDNLTDNNVLYIAVSIRNSSSVQKRVRYYNFYLTDTNGVKCKPLKPSDAIDATMQPGESVNGGIAFAVPATCSPRIFVYTEGFRDLDRVELPSLGKAVGLDDLSQSKSRIRDSLVKLQGRNEDSNPLGFMISDIKKNYTNVQGPREMSDHPGWLIYNGERNGVSTIFYVKSDIVYLVSTDTTQATGSKYISQNDLEQILALYSNGQQWQFLGNATLKMMSEWKRSDGQASCEAFPDGQYGFVGITIKTGPSNQIMMEDLKSINRR